MKTKIYSTRTKDREPLKNNYRIIPLQKDIALFRPAVGLTFTFTALRLTEMRPPYFRMTAFISDIIILNVIILNRYNTSTMSLC